MNLPWQSAAESQLGSVILEKHRVGGGDFAEAYQASLQDGRTIFIKTHSNPPAGFFSTEANGLKWLRESGHVSIPEVLAFDDSPPFLAMEWIDISGGRPSSDSTLGEQLAELHRASFPCFGRPDRCTTGSLALPNEPCDNWPDFYAERRLLPLARLAFDRRSLSGHCIEKIEQVAGRLDEFGASDEPPSLLHGDLWAGNRVVDSTGKSWLIDPAVHGGHREFDLAMMRLFGGYGSDCFDRYHDVFPLQVGWQERIALHQLAPLVVHAIKFGGSYAAATENAVEQYV